MLSISGLWVLLSLISSLIDIEDSYFPSMCSWIFWWLRKLADDKVTVIEAERRALENSPEAQAIREALNPWRNKDAETSKTP